MATVENLQQKIRDQDVEITRYKETLAKMEKQWKNALDAVNENKLQKIVDDLTNQINNQNKIIINLRKDNQTLRLKAHMVDDDAQLESKGGGDKEGITALTMERIKDLEKTLKNKELEYQEKMIDTKGKVNELELEIRSKEKNIETLSKKVNDLMDENKQIRRVAQNDEVTKLRIELKAAKEKLSIVEGELRKTADHSKNEIGFLQEECQRLKELMGNSLNVDKALKERCGQLEIYNTTLTKKVNEYESELIKLSKIKKELIDDRDLTMREKMEQKAVEDSYRQELKQVKMINDELDIKVKDLHRQLMGADPQQIKEQKELINDMKKKVLILEKELKIVYESSQKEIDQYKEEIEMVRGTKSDNDVNKDIKKQIEKNSLQKMKAELYNVKQELENSQKTITDLNQELKTQQDYFENEMLALKQKQNSNSNALGNELGFENEQMTQGALLARIKNLEKRLKLEIEEKDETLKQITMLKQELTIQEEHYKNEIKSQLEYANQFASSSLLNDTKFVELMTKLNDEQKKYYKDKTHFENNVKVTSEVARQKVRELENELEKQSKFFDMQSKKYEQEIELLRDYKRGQQKDLDTKDEQIKMLFEESDKYQNDKKEVVSVLKTRDIELQKCNKKIQELQKQLTDLQILQNRMVGQGAFQSRAPSANPAENQSQRGSGFLPDITNNKGPKRPQSQVRGAIAKQIKLTSDQFYTKWNQSGNNDAVKSELLDSIIGDNGLRLECVKKKQEFLMVLRQAFDSQTSIIYEKATIILSDLADARWLQQSELQGLNAVNKIIRTLAIKRPIEDNNYSMNRQISAINLLCRLDKWNIEWSQQMSDELSKMQGIDTIVQYLEQSQHENYKSQAAQIVGMIAEEGTINHLLIEHDTLSILLDSLLHKSLIVKRNCAEAIAFYIKDENARNNIKDDRILTVSLTELQKSNDQILTENILLIMMNLSLSKHFKPAIYEAGLLDSLIYNMVNGHTTEEQIYAIRISFNLCYNSEIKARNYEKLHPYISQVLKQGKVDVMSQALLLLKKLVEGEKTSIDTDLKILPTIIECAKNEDQKIQEQSLRILMHICENNPVQVLTEFENKGQGIRLCINQYVKQLDPNISLVVSHILSLFCLNGFASSLNQQGKQDFLSKVLKNFTAEDEKLRIQAIKMLSLLLQDQAVHEIVHSLSDFQFLVNDISEMANYDSLYEEEQDLLMYVLRIFGEFSRSRMYSELNIMNGLLPICVKILADDRKFKKEVRMWALIIINRGCAQAGTDGMAERTFEKLITSESPSFIQFLLKTTDPEDLDFTMHSKNIWEVTEQSANRKHPLLLQVFEKNYSLIEKLIIGTKRTMNSKSEISPTMRNTINGLRSGSQEIEKMVKEATKVITSKP